MLDSKSYWYGIRGNERADDAEKLALSSAISSLKCPPTDFYQDLANRCQTLWQEEWDGYASNKLHSVKPNLGYLNLSNLSRRRRDAVILRRLRIGHTRFSHSYLLNREDQPQCTYCDCALTVVHILIECHYYNSIRQRYFSVSNLKDLFERVNAHTIVNFIKDIGFYNHV